MPQYISAYDLQQREGLTRLEVIERAENGPAYWKIHDGTVSDNGLERLKMLATGDWLHLVLDLRRIIHDECDNVIPDDLLERMDLDRRLGEMLPDAISGRDANKVFRWGCPANVQVNIDAQYSTYRVIEDAKDKDDIINLLFMLPRHEKEAMWNVLKNWDERLFDLYFERIFNENLFLADKQTQEADVPAAESKQPEKELPEFTITPRVSQNGSGSAQVRATVAENEIALQYVEHWHSLQWDKARIAQELKTRGASYPVAGCLLFPNKPSTDAAGQAVKRLLGKK